ncbi:MAG: hypothetical protein D6737_19790, partial [Chloroflexi bacterium]
MQDLSGQKLEEYELLEFVESGGFGAIYRALQPSVDRDVAIKIIRADHANQPEFIRSFETEARLVARLEHPFITPLYDFWRNPAGAYLVMRWMPGGSLADAMYRSVWSMAQLTRLVEQISSALFLAHRSGVVHQDIKPGNILLDADGNAYLTDFGIAKDLLNPESGINTLLYASPAYMSPEQVRRSAVTPAADMYSFGIVLFQILTGHLPYEADDKAALMRDHLEADIPSLRTYRDNMPDALDAVIRRMMAKDPRDRFPDMLAAARAFREAAPLNGDTLPLGDSKATLVEGTIPFDLSQTGEYTLELTALLEPENPYKGLQSFDEADADTFFGRDAFVQQLLDHLSQDGEAARFLAVVGPSGSGKSSVVKAGLLPEMWRGMLGGSEMWFVTTMTPGAAPFDALEKALLRVAVHAPDDMTTQLRQDAHGLRRLIEQVIQAVDTEIVLVIDQFEELFTLVASEAERALFLESLTNAIRTADSHLRIIITLRADFYDRPLLYPVFGQLIHQHTQVILPMTPEELDAAIRGPADTANLVLEDGLVAAIVNDVHQQPGALPLVQYALTELFERRSADNTLTLQAYRDIGGISGALAKRADEIFADLSAAHQPMARQLFLRLVAVDDAAEDARRRVKLPELLTVGDKTLMQHTIDVFSKYRLLTLDRDPATRIPTIEVAHEALIREWTRLREWLADNRSALRLQRQIAAAADDWVRGGRDASFVATGMRLAQYETLMNAGTLALSADEKAYIQAGITLRERHILRRRLFIVGLVMIAFVASLLAIFAFTQQRRAEEQARIALSRQLSVTALRTLDEQYDVALLLGLEALAINDSFETRSGLLTALQHHPDMGFMLHDVPGAIRGVAVSADGRWLAAGGTDNTIALWDMTTRQRLAAPLTGHSDWVTALAFSPDATLLASGSVDDTIILWDMTTREAAHTLNGHDGDVWHVAFNPDGTRLIAAGGDGIITEWDATTGERIDSLTSHDGIVYSAVYNAAGDVIASAGDDSLIRLWDAATGEPIGEPLAGHNNWVLDLAFVPVSNGVDVLASSSADGNIFLWDVGSGEPVGALTGHDGWVWSLDFSPDGMVLASGGEDGTVRLWDMTTGRAARAPFAAYRDDVRSVAFDGVSGMVFAGSLDGQLIAWDSTRQHTLHTPLAQQNEAVADVVLTPDERFIISADGNPRGASNDIYVWDAATGALVYTLTGHEAAVTGIDINPAGDTLASASADG